MESKGWSCSEEDACAEVNEEDGCCGSRGQGLRPQSDSGEWVKGGAVWTENSTGWQTQVRR